MSHSSTILKRAVACAALIAAAVAALIAVLAIHGTSSSVAGPAPVPPEITSLLPAYAAALNRPAIEDEQQVVAAPGAADARVLLHRDGHTVYISRVTAANALCLSVRHDADGVLSSTCAGVRTLRSGDFRLGISGDSEDTEYAAGVAPDRADEVAVTTDAGTLTAPVDDDGIYLVRTKRPVTSIRFMSAAGETLRQVAVPQPSLR